MKNISITAIVISIFVIILGTTIFGPLLFLGVGIAIGTVFNDKLRSLDNLFVRRQELSNSTQAIENEPQGIKFNQKFYNKAQDLKESFKDFQAINVFREEAFTSAMQLSRSTEKFDRYIEILNGKFNKEELAYSKFFLTVEQVYAAVLENLEKIDNKFKGLGGKDYVYIVQRLENLEKEPKLTQAQLEEMSAIRQKKGMVKKEMKNIREILSATEGVIVGLDRILIEVSNLNTSSSSLDVSGRFAIEELEQLIKNAGMYNLN